VGARRSEGDDSLAPVLELAEVRPFLQMLLILPDDERSRLLGFLSLLIEWRGFGEGFACGVASQPDPVVQELLDIVSGLSQEDKSFLLESARYVARRKQTEN